MSADSNPFLPSSTDDNTISGINTDFNSSNLLGFDMKEKTTEPQKSPTEAYDIPAWYGFGDSAHPKDLLTPQGVISPPRKKGEKGTEGNLKPKKKSLLIKTFELNPFDDVVFVNGLNTPVASKDDDQDFPVKFPDANSETGSKEKKAELSDTQENSEKGSNTQNETKVNAIKFMQAGSSMLKYGRHGTPHYRRLEISRDLKSLVWYSRKKAMKDTRVMIADIEEVLCGQQTEVFKKCTRPSLERSSFSVVHGLKQKTVDVVAKTREEAKIWIQGLNGLVKAHRKGKLSEVVSIFVNVSYEDVTKKLLVNCTKDITQEEREEVMKEHEKDLGLAQDVIEMMEMCVKEYKATNLLAQSKNVIHSMEQESIQVSLSDIESKIDIIQYGFDNHCVKLMNLKRCLWYLNLDILGLKEKLHVLIKQ